MTEPLKQLRANTATCSLEVTSTDSLCTFWTLLHGIGSKRSDPENESNNGVNVGERVVVSSRDQDVIASTQAADHFYLSAPGWCHILLFIYSFNKQCFFLQFGYKIVNKQIAGITKCFLAYLYLTFTTLKYTLVHCVMVQFYGNVKSQCINMFVLFSRWTEMRYNFNAINYNDMQGYIFRNDLE